jgi:hypothetical protein
MTGVLRLGKSECPETNNGSFAVVTSKGGLAVPTTTSPLSGSILYRDQRKTLDLLEAAAKEWTERARPGQTLNEETVSLLAQMTRICLRSPARMRDLWEWGKSEELAGRLPDRQRAAETLREQLDNWLELLHSIQQAAKVSEAAGHSVSGVDKLEGAEDELRVILRGVNETWPLREADATSPLSYEELHRLANRFPPPAPWYEEEDDLF